MTDFEGSIDNIFRPFWDAWKAGSAAIAGYQQDVQWAGMEEGKPHDCAQFWARGSQKLIDTRIIVDKGLVAVREDAFHPGGSESFNIQNISFSLFVIVTF